MHKIHKAIVLAVLPLTAAGIFGSRALADGDEGRVASPLLPKYLQECGTCHAPYPPHMLPVASWQRILSKLDKHYGTDASLDAQTAVELSKWLNANAAKPATHAPPEDRITRSAWFRHEHDEVAAETWKRATVKSPANCGACHQQADQGDYREQGIRIPR